MFELYCELSKAVDVFNETRVDAEQLEYYEVLNLINDRYDEKEIMQLIIQFYSDAH